MPDFVNIGKVSDFPPNKVTGVVVNGKPVAIVPAKSGFFAFANECTHLGVELTASYITPQDEVICLLHDSIYDMRTGKIVDGPAFDDLPVYSVKVDGDDLLVATD